VSEVKRHKIIYRVLSLREDRAIRFAPHKKKRLLVRLAHRKQSSPPISRKRLRRSYATRIRCIERPNAKLEPKRSRVSTEKQTGMNATARSMVCCGRSQVIRYSNSLTSRQYTCYHNVFLFFFLCLFSFLFCQRRSQSQQRY
jgi:hypothetical protein